jgi:Cu/Ag efflux pump CusA
MRLRVFIYALVLTGLTPLAVGLGEGGGAQAPLARVVIGGLTSSTFITLVFVPTVYSLLARRTEKLAQEAVEVQPVPLAGDPRSLTPSGMRPQK